MLNKGDWTMIQKPRQRGVYRKDIAARLRVHQATVRQASRRGGAPSEALVDDQKAAIMRHRIGERVQFNERFFDLGYHYGLTPKACRPYRRRTRGKDEQVVGYAKYNFFQRYRTFESLEHVNQLAGQWLAGEADLRVHSTVKKMVVERFKREALHLKPLPQVRYDTSYRERRWVNWDGYVDVRGNRYSVSDELRGKPVTVRIDLDGFFSVCDCEAKVVDHRLRLANEGWVTVPSHHEGLWRDTLKVKCRDPAVYEEVATCSS